MNLSSNPAARPINFLVDRKYRYTEEMAKQFKKFENNCQFLKKCC